MNPNASLLDRAGLDKVRVGKLIDRGLEGADDGELFLEYKQSEMLVFDNGRLKQATYDTNQGFGLRAVKDEAVGYAHASDVSEARDSRAADAVRAVKGGHSGKYAEAPGRTNVKLYGDDNPLEAPGFDAKIKLLETIDAYARAKDQRVKQVTASLGASWQVVEIVRPDGQTYRDIRPLVRVNVSVVAASGDRQESGSFGYGGREGYQGFIDCQDLAARRRRGGAPGAAQSRIRFRRRPARWTSCSAPAGPASCCTRRSATASKATSTARGRRPLPA